MQPFEVIEVHSLEVVCDGSVKGAKNTKNNSGHPKVYLHIDPDKGEIACPYCSRQFVLRLMSGTYGGSH